MYTEVFSAITTIANTLKNCSQTLDEIVSWVNGQNDRAKLKRERFMRLLPNPFINNVEPEKGGEKETAQLKYGQGCLVKRERRRKKDNSVYTYWQASYYDENGERKTVTGKTQEITLKRLKEVRVKPQKKQSRQHFQTFEEWAEEWILLYKIPENKKTSIAPIRMYLRTRINPVFAKMQLKAIKTLDIMHFLSKIEESNTRQKVYDVLNGCLREACNVGKIQKNPCDPIKRPSHDSENRRGYTFEEQDNMMRVLPDRFKPVFFFLCSTGLRVGEFVALDDSLVKDGYVFVKKTKDRDTGELSDPKRKSVRRIPYTEQLFTHVPKFGFFGTFTYHEIKKAFQDAFDKLEVTDLCIHSTRHTFASLCHKAKIDDLLIQRWMGHKTLAMTKDTYTHFMSSGNSEVFQYILTLKSFE